MDWDIVRLIAHLVLLLPGSGGNLCGCRRCARRRHLCNVPLAEFAVLALSACRVAGVGGCFGGCVAEWPSG